MGISNLTIQDRVILVLRNGTRKFVNEEETIAGVHKALSSSTFFCHPVRFEKLTLEEQAKLVMTSRILIGYHGQGLAWTSMLRTAFKQCATIELFAAGLALPRDYRDFSAANNATYFSSPHRKFYRDCNDLRVCGDISVDIQSLAAVLGRAISAISPIV
jgi:capsular polysaccharide biosynthesis protein